jgi:hypothetical protein
MTEANTVVADSNRPPALVVILIQVQNDNCPGSPLLLVHRAVATQIRYLVGRVADIAQNLIGVLP